MWLCVRRVRLVNWSCSTKDLMFRCSSCFATRSFWSVSGKWTKKSIQVGDKMIPKRNDTVYASVLGRRIIGIGENKLRLYHGALNIPHPPVHSTFKSQSLLLLNMLPPEVFCPRARNKTPLRCYLWSDR